MNSELYTAASGLINEQRRLDMISNNLANMSTSGFRAQRLFSTVYSGLGRDAPSSVRAANAGVAVAGAYDVPGPGPVRSTGRDLDVALEDGSFLTVQTAGGRRYARAGNLTVSASGALTDTAGRGLLDPRGKPISGLSPDTSIASDGRVLSNGSEVARLAVVRDPGGVLIREGDGLLAAGGREGELEAIAQPRLRPGWLEGSSTDPLIELVQLIEAQRSFESNQRLISLTMNEVNRRAINDLAG